MSKAESNKRYYEENKVSLAERRKEKRKLRSRRQIKKEKELVLRQYRLRVYGMTHEEFKQRIINQDNKCPICFQNFDRVPHVDHDHETNKNRDILCRDCNIGLGLFKDNIETLSSAIKYLRRHQ